MEIFDFFCYCWKIEGDSDTRVNSSKIDYQPNIWAQYCDRRGFYYYMYSEQFLLYAYFVVFNIEVKEKHSYPFLNI